MSWTSAVSTLAVISSTGLALATAPAALAAPRPGTSVTVAIEGTSPVRVDQDPGFRVTVAGLDNRSTARVNFGDGTGTKKTRGTCSVAKAKRAPQACAVSIAHTYRTPGTFTISAAAARTRASEQVTIAAKPEPWRPSPGQQFSAWEPLGSRATYTPCQTVAWYFDTSGQPGDRSTMRDDVIASLAQLSGLTNLTFVETTDPNRADLTFSWRNPAEFGYSGDVAGVGGFTGPSKGWVAFSPSNEWTNDYWAGDQPKTKRWEDSGWIYTLTINGRQTLVTHEVMHALGFGHVEDFTSIMYPQSIGNGAGQLSAGDLEGLAAMYGSLPCPLIPD